MLDIRKLISQENEKNLINEYIDGEFTTVLAKRYDIKRHQVIIILKRNNIKIVNNNAHDLKNKVVING
jgi:hypothetical protein